MGRSSILDVYAIGYYDPPGWRQSQSHIYITTGGLPVIRSSTHDFHFPNEHLRLYSLCNILSEERMGLSFIIAAGSRQCSHSQVRVLWDSWTYFTLSDSRLRQHGEQVPRIYIPQLGGPAVAPALGSLFVASYDSQDYGGGIHARLHKGVNSGLIARIGSHYIASGQTQKGTLHIKTVLLLRVYLVIVEVY
jgi:hypothetical protein